MGDKMSLLKLLRKYDEKSLYSIGPKNFLPETYAIDFKKTTDDEIYCYGAKNYHERSLLFIMLHRCTNSYSFK